MSPENSVPARRTTRVPLRHRAIVTAALTTTMAGVLSLVAPAHATAATAYALTTANQIVVFDTATPTTAGTPVAITGLQPGESILGIDVRPATGQLYALGSSSRLYVINVATGAATQVGTTTFTTGLLGASFGFDFNPTVDRIRVVSDQEQNLRLNPDTGALAGADTNLATAGDIVGSAYTNNHSGALTTTLYGIDSVNDQLVLQGGVNGAPSPNLGAITPVGALGVDTSNQVGFDITANDGVAYAALTVAGTSSFYTVNLTSGAATLVGAIGAGLQVRGLAILSRGVTLYGVTSGNALARFHSATPGTIVSTTNAVVPITGLQGGETVLGIDFRPANGRLYALGSTSRIYIIDTATGRATAVGVPFTPALSGTQFGFDFNPVPDRIRVVSNTGQNLRLHPDTGAVAGNDSALNPPPGTGIVGAAYTNNVDGATQTTLYDIEADADQLVLQGSIGGAPNSPNLGTLTPVGPLGVNTTDVVGFDISPLDGIGFAALLVGGTSNLYTIDLAGGTARLIGAIGAGAPIVGLAAAPTNFIFAEGSTGLFFDTDLLLLNPTATATPATITYLREDGTITTQGLTLAANSRATVLVDTVPGVESTPFSAVVSSPLGLPLVAERTMRWDPTGYGSHTEKGAEALARTWYFAEGAQGFFDTFLLLANPGQVTTTANVLFLLEGGGTVARSYPVPPRSRLTVYAGGIPELANQSFGTTVTFTIAAAAERAMYFGTPTFNAGHESAGVTLPSTNWFLAEGATGQFFTTFLLLANPGSAPANVTLNFLQEGGGLVTKVKTVQPQSRLTINIALEDPSLVATAVATQVISDVPIVAERAQYWPFSFDQWYEAHNSFGVTQTASRWGLSEGRVGGTAQDSTFILLANPDALPANVVMTFIHTGAPVTKNFLVAANGRLTVTTGPGGMVPELANESFGTLVVADRPIFVERAFYSSPGGVPFAAGTNATATAVP